MTSHIADVLIPLALDTAYSYAVPSGLALKEGDVVQVPLGTREVVGVVWALRPGAGSNFKAVTDVVEAPGLSPKMRRFLDWVAWYTLAPKGSALGMGLKLADLDRPEVVRVGIRMAGPAPKRMTPTRQRVIDAAGDGRVRLKRDLAQEAGVSVGVIDGLVDEGTFETVALLSEPAAEPPDPDFSRTGLSDDQRAAAARLVATMTEVPPPVSLLEGVTGSGKTEVYFEAVAEAVRQGRQALILMPEIALTAQFLDRFEARFGAKPASWHSGVTGRRRERIYAGIASGEVKVVAGARSALFLPYSDLGLIVVDEEHETAYKQEDGVHYHARDMAVVRGRIENAAVILASATPSIESRTNVERGPLPARAACRSGSADAPAPDPRHRSQARGHPARALAVAELDRRHRGDASIAASRRCFSSTGAAMRRLPSAAPAPIATNAPIARLGSWSIGSDGRWSATIAGMWSARPTPAPPAAQSIRWSRAGPASSESPKRWPSCSPTGGESCSRAIFPAGQSGFGPNSPPSPRESVDIVIGTQLVAKGHNFPLMTLVGVLDADIGLTSGDPRAAERTFQLLQQVTGRAGRGDKPGRALVQTWQPDHPVIAALVSGEAERFYREETRVRQLAGLPPFGRLASLIVSATERDAAEAHARAMAKVAEPTAGITVLGPAEAPLALIRGRYRYRLLVKTERDVDLQAYLRAWTARCPKTRGNTRVAIDVDPQSFL